VRSSFREGALVVLRSPTGSGKSTRVPLHLLEELEESGREGEIWVVQPRRLAARSLAQHVAGLIGEPCGERVGYKVRFDTRTSARTRIVFLTPGVALRQLAAGDAASRRVLAVLIDEFHERGAEADAIGALVLAARSGNQGPSLWLLSATIDMEPLARWMGPFGRVDLLESEGRQYPVAITYRGFGGTDLCEGVSRAVVDQLRERPQGDLLCFLPGVGEIRRTADLLSRRLANDAGVRILPLHGDMEPEDQDAALRPAPAGSVHVILATNVAETSLTLPGVRHVIDGGYARVARFDPRRGLDTLYTIRASQRSADQRAGRAGRTAPGTCWRLWNETDAPPGEEPPEICRTDLSGLWLALASRLEPRDLPWPTAPSSERVDSATILLRRLGALDDRGRTTDLGRRMGELPLGPRAARVLLAAEAEGGFDAALRWAAQWESQGRDEGDRLRRSLQDRFRPVRRETDLGRLLLRGFPDRLAIACGQGRWRLPDGRVAELVREHEDDSVLGVALEVQELAGGGKGPVLKLRSFEPVRPEWVREAYPDLWSEEIEVEWDPRSRRVAGSRVSRFEGQIVASTPLDDNRIPRPKAEEVLAARVASGDIRWRWGEDEDEWVRRTRLVADAFPERNLSKLDEDDLDLVRAALVEGCLAAGGVESREVLPLLREVQGHEQVSFVERMAPTSVGLSSGRKAKLLYGPDGSVLLSARIGDFVGVKQESVRLAQGRIPMVFEILAPNHRPVQRTSDLDGFWERSYPAIKADLKRRYPRHPWP
jgi:ATP-dependent helicase HrpB